MLIYWLIYIATLIASCCFFILYKDILALMLLIVIVALPFLLLLLHVISSFLTRVNVEMKNSVVSKTQQSQIVVQIQNRSPVPVINIDIHLTLENVFLQTRQTCRFSVSAPPFSNKKNVFALSSDHVGRVEVKLQKIVFYDFMRLFKRTKKVRAQAEALVFPDLYPLEVSLRPNAFTAVESDVFSKVKPGDDPSEVFAIREYAGGDKLNRIHWKLSAKTNDLMVKDYSLPVSESVLLYVDLGVDFKDPACLSRLDTVIDALFSICGCFGEQEKYQRICWYNASQQQFMCYTIKDADDLYEAVAILFGNGIYNGETVVDLEQQLQKSFVSNLLFFTPDTAQAAMQKLSRLQLPKTLCTVICASDPADITVEDLHLVCVNAADHLAALQQQEL